MIEGLKAYADSAKTKPMTRTSEINIPWLTAIPEHWKVVRSKGLFTARTERARPDDEQLSATQAYGVIPQKEFENRVGRKVVRITQNLEKRAHVEPDDFVISMRSFQGGLERAWARGCIRSSYVVLKPSPETVVGYFAHLFKSLDYIRALQATSNFIRDGQDLNFNNFSLVDLPLPPLDEQAAIARCLDHANRKIDGFIRAKRKLIGLLNEQKQAIIHRAVTRGLDPDVPLKPSGIPWLGDIPEHWESWPLRRCITIRSGDFADPLKLRSEPTRENCVPVVGGNGVMGYLDKPNNTGATIVIGRVGALCGNVHLVEGDTWITDNALRITRIAGFEAGYLAAQLKVMNLNRLANANAQPLVTGGIIKSQRVVKPPSQEQRDIFERIPTLVAPLNTAITRTEREIALMQEYRTRLTADIVTGKLDVREAAAKLPDLPTEPAGEALTDEALDDAEAEDAEA